jgi:4-hydroxy-tetrahydrodipicolinate reductase
VSQAGKQLAVVVAGLTGRMGKEISGIAADCGLKIVGGLGRQSGSLADWIKANSKPDVVIDFSLPEATIAIAEACATNGIPLVSGVTGLSDTQKSALETAAKKIPVLYSANMSIGLQMLAKALDALKGAEGFDISIEDIHHRHKKDAPSGTAKLLNEELRRRTGQEAQEIVSLRGGGVIGTHRILALSESESLIFEHTALNRTIFARGACRAARWIVGRPAGYYSLRETL